MIIKTKFYYAEKGKYHGSGDLMILKDRQIIGLGSEIKTEDEKRPFYYDDTNYIITYVSAEKKNKVEINKLITEANYTIKQREYLTRLTWFQKQKLLWMFSRHWLQEPGITIHLLIAGLMLTLAFVGFEVINSYF